MNVPCGRCRGRRWAMDIEQQGGMVGGFTWGYGVGIFCLLGSSSPSPFSPSSPIVMPGSCMETDRPWKLPSCHVKLTGEREAPLPTLSHSLTFWFNEEIKAYWLAKATVHANYAAINVLFIGRAEPQTFPQNWEISLQEIRHAISFIYQGVIAKLRGN